MRAIVLEELNSPLQLRNLELSKLKFGQVLVRVNVSGICGAQLQEIRGHKGNSGFLPHLLGHEGSGIVEKIGPGVSRVSVGDKVSMHWRQGLGIDAPFPEYFLGRTKVSGGKVTTLSELSITSENRLTVVPHQTPDDLAALLGCAITTALGIVDNEINLKFGETALVVGCGGVGLNLIQALFMKSASRIIGIDKCSEKEELAKSLGADEFIATTDPEYLEKLRAKTFLGLFDVIIDTTGSTDLISSIIPLLSSKGRFIMVGQPSPGSHLSFLADSTFFGTQGKLIKTTQGGSTNPNVDIPNYLQLFFQGKLNYEQTITHRFSLNMVNEAFNVLQSGKSGRIMIDIKE